MIGVQTCALPISSRALKAARLLAARGIEARVVDMRWVKPMDEEAIRDACDTRLIVTVEAGVIAGGAGEGVCGYLAEMGLDSPVRMLGVPDVFVPQGRADLLSEDLGLDPEGIANAILETLAEQVA